MFRVPAATYRLQLNAGFKFEDARRIAPYLRELGITDIYSSPILRARTGSAHGYDVVDAFTLNPELGTDDDFLSLHDELQKQGLGFLLDIVPNHMAASHENAWWMSVLEHGENSRFLHYFDIDLNPITTRDRTELKVLLPILGKPYGEVVESGQVKLGFDSEGFFFTYYENRLPLAPRSYNQILDECVDAVSDEIVSTEVRDMMSGESTTTNSRFIKETLWRLYENHLEFRKALDAAIARFNGNLGDPDSFNPLDSLLESQYYRLAYWRIASEKINYRRFFDVTGLVGVRIENPEVFEARHRRILQLIAEGKVTGLRIDHPDGLFEPMAYTKRMQSRLADPAGGSVPAEGGREQPFYIVIEKILSKNEVLSKAFAVSGTTGYDFLDTLNALFVDPDGLQKLTRFYRSLTGITSSFDDMCYERKKQVISELFPGEMRQLGKRLGELSMRDRNARDFTPSELLAALVEITASMDVYRTYIRDTEPGDEDRACIRAAIEEARVRAGSTMDFRLFQFLQCVLLLDPPSYLHGERDNWLAFVRRWQQFTGRVMAKGVEDTAFYNYNRLISLNDVGGHPGREGDFDPVEEFHARNERIQRDWPDTMNATSTHDTKRSEDVRARINVLSEIPEVWEREVKRWSAMNTSLRSSGFPDPNEELLLYQTLLGMWPVDSDELEEVPERLRQYLEKASREAKTHTNWISPNAEFEKAFLEFATRILEKDVFRAAFARLQKRVAFHGFLNAMSQLVLKITSPGLPDFYQGTELWDLSLVDPDNRRPVDYERRAALLKKLKTSFGKGSLDLSSMIRRWFDGRIKLFVTWKGLELRTARIETFRRGEYRRIRSDSVNVVSFARGDDIVVAVPRLTAKLTRGTTPPVGEVWGETTLTDFPRGRWRDIFSGRELVVEKDTARAAEVFAEFPVAVLERF
ncbi:MAG TPA: malto-oligosyltrehalose synthase [Thermoanaerobaculia bacterium]|nr:malto-oligosyltrehalose synthase [Thermoanaerobaculia bacterium]